VAGPTVVIGAGLAGLAAAIHLAAAGREVIVLEAGTGPGGCCGTAQVGGYRFDTGPSVLTMPEVLAETMGAAGQELADWVPLAELDPYYRLAFHDGSHLDVLAGAGRMAAEVQRLAGPAEARRYLRFREQLRLLQEAEWGPFVTRDFRRLADFAHPRVAGQLARLARLGALRRMGGLAARYLTDWRLIHAHTFQALYVGLDPARASGIYAVIAAMDTVGGVCIPRQGGMHAVPRALADVAVKAGAQLCYGTRAARVLTDGSGVTGVALAGGGWLRTASVIVAGDRLAAHRDLLPAAAADWRLRRPRLAPSCLVAHFGLDHQRPGQAHHTLHLGRSWAATFDALTRRNDVQPGPDPSLLVTAPSRDPDAAPAGHATLSVLEPTANLLGGHDWAATTPRLLDRLLGRLGQLGYGDLASAPARLVIDPPGWAARGHTGGTPFGLDHRLSQTAWFRPAMSARRVPGLYFAGAGTVPGIGVPMVLISGRLAARAALDDGR
jgi:phytoene desaturase